VAEANAAADADETVLRLSIDSKARVKVGNLSRGGKDRRQQAPQADDHDTQWQGTVLPFGILNLQSDELALYFSESAETSDFIVDCLEHWWATQQAHYAATKTLAIDLDGGSATRSNRTQFIKRMVEFSRRSGLTLQLIYYPPYHSKYNPIERCWAALEQFWNGAILDSVETALQWASHLLWRGTPPLVEHVQQVYEKGVTVDAETLAAYRVDWHPSEDLPKWAITIGAQ
jgi:hypothetical protein